MTNSSASDKSSELSLFDVILMASLLFLAVWTGIVFFNACSAAADAPTGKFGQVFNDHMPIWMQIFLIHSIYKALPSNVNKK